MTGFKSTTSVWFGIPGFPIFSRGGARNVNIYVQTCDDERACTSLTKFKFLPGFPGSVSEAPFPAQRVWSPCLPDKETAERLFTQERQAKSRLINIETYIVYENVIAAQYRSTSPESRSSTYVRAVKILHPWCGSGPWRTITTQRGEDPLVPIATSRSFIIVHLLS